MLMENIDNFVTEFVNLKNDIDLKNIQFAYDYLFAFFSNCIRYYETRYLNI